MAKAADRRRSARVALLGRVRGQIVCLEMPVTVRDMSLDGMSIETPAAFEIGSIASFLLTLGDGSGVEVSGKVVHARPVEGSEPPLYLSGIQFVDGDDRDSHTAAGTILANLH